jgi:biopolymer transport protein TolQ
MTMETGLPVLLAAAGLHADPLRLIADSGPLAKLVLLILLIFSVLSWAVIVGRYRYLKRAESASVRLQRDISVALRLSQLNEIAGRYPASPLSAIMQAGFREMISAVNEGLAGQRAGTITPEQARERVFLRVRRRAEESASIEADGLDRNLGLLATT